MPRKVSAASGWRCRYASSERAISLSSLSHVSGAGGFAMTPLGTRADSGNEHASHRRRQNGPGQRFGAGSAAVVGQDRPACETQRGWFHPLRALSSARPELLGLDAVLHQQLAQLAALGAGQAGGGADVAAG